MISTITRESIMIFGVPVRRKIVRTAELVHILEFSFLKYLFKVFWKGSFRMSSPNFDFSRTQFYVIFSTSYVILTSGSDQFIPKFNHADVILTILISIMTHLIYWRIRRFEIISISVVWRLFGINESFLEDMTSRLFNRVSFKSHISHFPKWDFYRGV